MKHLLLAIVVILASPCGHAEQVTERLELFFVPWALHLKTQKDPASSSEPHYYPLTPNRVSDCLPGKLYDVRSLFEEHGAKFGSTGFAWYCPDASLLAVRAAPEDVDFAEAFLSSTLYCPPSNLRLRGEIVVQPANGGDAQPAYRLRWEVFTRSGQRTTLSSGGVGPLGYSCEIESVVGPEGKFIDYTMVVKVTCDGREYSASPSATIALSKPHSLLLGTTPTGDEVRLQITLDWQQPQPSSPLDNAAIKKQLLDSIERATRNR